MRPFVLLLAIAAFLTPFAAIASRRLTTLRRAGAGVSPLAYLAASLASAVLFLFVFHEPDAAIPLFLTAAAVGLAWLWAREFLALMAAGDDAFPGRNDKVLWFLLLVLVPPVGLATFAAFRRAYWAPEKAPAAAEVAGEGF